MIWQKSEVFINNFTALSLEIVRTGFGFDQKYYEETEKADAVTLSKSVKESQIWMFFLFLPGCGLKS